MKDIKVVEFIEFLRTMNCLSYPEVLEITTETAARYIMGKFEQKGIKAVFDLDNNNLATVLRATKARYKRNQENQ